MNNSPLIRNELAFMASVCVAPMRGASFLEGIYV